MTYLEIGRKAETARLFSFLSGMYEINNEFIIKIYFNDQLLIYFKLQIAVERMVKYP